ncbi:acetyl-CoA acetyltransferase [Halobacillus andaensis]|uniref:acetyl-CoA C-acetyltransferase n=1 Tax=Halobacillus andaensis TaxID=1176239 RepID=A0A917B6H9_HALAA|nr:acetyl-CoA C-acyltransferase [Halobacillus andaensis]MBP2006437.1 acetyl-CoA C-acetyltransferase [Halobacillus andaensis]GGF27386.1 acetyl-CoA acetyltransferase [Halobacillus andaensis]
MKTVLLDGTRTPFGKWKGALRKLSATDLGKEALTSLVEKHPEAKQADGVLLAQVIQAGQGQNPARQVAFKAGIDPATPAITLNNVCLGGIATIADASRRLQLNEGELYIVGGFDSMTNAPHTAPVRMSSSIGHAQLKDTLLNDGLWCSLTDVSMGALTDEKNRSFDINREDQDEFAALSQQRAAEAQKNGSLNDEISPLSNILDQDEGVRANTTAEKLESLSPAFSQDGTITAGNASQMTDGASIGIVTTEQKAKELGRSPLAEIVDWAEVAGPDTSLQTKPSKAIKQVLDKHNLTTEDIDLYEINEAFSSVVIASCRELEIDYSRVNVNGGAIALGHPLGGTGFRLVLTLAHELKRRGGGKGIASLCGGGGQGMAVLIEVPKS